MGWEKVYLLFILNLDTRWGWVVSITPRPRFTPGERTVGTHWIGGWVGSRAGLDAEARRKILCPCRRSNTDGPVRSQTLYCLSYPGSKLIDQPSQNLWVCHVTISQETRLRCDLQNFKVSQVFQEESCWYCLIGQDEWRKPKDAFRLLVLGLGVVLQRLGVTVAGVYRQLCRHCSEPLEHMAPIDCAALARARETVHIYGGTRDGARARVVLAHLRSGCSGPTI
jgi:hypothetical protein